MAGVNGISSKFVNTISKPVKWVGNQFQKNPEKALAYSTVGSIIVKDGVGCYKYVTQSLNNEKIPEDKRNFVAALDLTNGVLMIAAQIGMFFAMRKCSEPIFNKLFKKSFGDKSKRFCIERMRMLQRKAGKTPSRKLDLAKSFDKVRDNSLALFKFIADISAATIIGKRVIVPFIATPLANIVKDKMKAHHEGKECMQNQKNNVVEKKEIDDDDLEIDHDDDKEIDD